MFVDRRQELSFLNSILECKQPASAQFVLVCGRPRVGKTRLLLHWAANSGLPFSYYPADKGPAVLQRKEFFARVVGGDSSESPAFESWTSCWQAIARFLADRRHILMIDEFPYLLAADPAASSALQHAWDHLFRESQQVIVLSGSHVHTMEHLQKADSPLFGRFTGQWHLEPLPFAALREFFPSWSAAERVAGYAITGGIPAYLEWLNPDLSFVKNIRQVILRPGSRFVSEPMLLLYDEVSGDSSLLAIIKAIGAGAHKLGEISSAAVVARNHLPTYLKRLRELRLVERRLAVTIPPARRRLAKTSRYHLADPFFRFYFRYVHKYRDELALRQEQLVPAIQDNLRSFVGETAFEELSRQWVVEQAAAGEFPFVVQEVGSHWSRGVQVDVVAVNWPEKKILLGECKWGEKVVSRNVVHDLIEVKTPKVLMKLPNEGTGWQAYWAFFARTRFTDAARAEAEAAGALLVDLERLDTDLSQVLASP